jgi:selenocysteine lyase/cysteine desulfurase
MTEPMHVNDFARYYDDGSIEVYVNPRGVPAFEYRLPLFGLDGAERERTLAAERRAFVLRGLFVTSERMIRNPAFDKRGEASTCRFSVRVCKTKAEVEQVVTAIKHALSEAR